MNKGPQDPQLEQQRNNYLLSLARYLASAFYGIEQIGMEIDRGSLRFKFLTSDPESPIIITRVGFQIVVDTNFFKKDIKPQVLAMQRQLEGRVIEGGVGITQQALEKLEAAERVVMILTENGVITPEDFKDWVNDPLMNIPDNIIYPDQDKGRLEPINLIGALKTMYTPGYLNQFKKSDSQFIKDLYTLFPFRTTKDEVLAQLVSLVNGSYIIPFDFIVKHYVQEPDLAKHEVRVAETLRDRGFNPECVILTEGLEQGIFIRLEVPRDVKLQNVDPAKVIDDPLFTPPYSDLSDTIFLRVIIELKNLHTSGIATGVLSKNTINVYERRGDDVLVQFEELQGAVIHRVKTLLTPGNTGDFIQTLAQDLFAISFICSQIKASFTKEEKLQAQQALNWYTKQIKTMLDKLRIQPDVDMKEINTKIRILESIFEN